MSLTSEEKEWIFKEAPKIDFLRPLSFDQLQRLTDRFTATTVSTDATVITAGQKGNTFFLIFDGKVSVWIEAHGKKKKLADLARGDYFGEISLLTQRPAIATVLANGPTHVLFLDTADFYLLLRENPTLRSEVATVIKNRLSEKRRAEELLAYGGLDEVAGAIDNLFNLTPTDPS